jgi:HSP20 family molecular chaperone IbpA
MGMDQFSFVNWRDYFDENGMPKMGNQTLNPFNQTQSLQQLKAVKQMVKEYQSVLNDEFWDGLKGINSKKKVTILPIEIWEDETNIYLFVVAPGLDSLKNAKIEFEAKNLLRLKVKGHSLKPTSGHAKFSFSEMPVNEYERDIDLPVKVDADYSASYEEGVLSYTFQKIKSNPPEQKEENKAHIPFNF